MKKLMSILLVLLMLTSVLASCGGNDETTTTEAPTTEAPSTEVPTTEAPTTEAPTTEAPTTEAPTTEAPSTKDPNVIWSSKDNVRDTWSGKTLNVACSVWYATGAPWAMPEVFITEKNDAKFGAKIQNAVLDRNEFIESTYGVKVNWINATDSNMHDALEAATLAKNINYDLAAPRMMNAQAIVAGGYVYDLANREFIDFRNSYYNEDSVKTYTAHNHTFFVTGGFSILDKESAYVLLFNKNLLGDGSQKATDDLYDLVKNGKWTYDKLVAYAEAAYKDNGDGIKNDTDIFGAFIGTGLYRFYDYFGIYQAGVNETTGQWEITFKNDEDKIDDIIDVIKETIDYDWFLNFAAGGWGSIHSVFKENRTLFYSQHLNSSYLSDYVDMGIVPFPMLNEEQGRYRVPCSTQMSVAMCIPKITQDRNMSDYFMDVLFWTGEEYTMKAYLETKKEHLKTDADMEMVTEYIIPNIFYDAGAAVGWSELLPNVKVGSWADGENKFDEVYSKAEPDALKTIAECNTAWGGYTEE